MKRPLIFYAISTAAGCVCAMEFFDNFIMCAAIAVLFFIIYFTTLDRKLFVINLVFFLFAMFSFFNYFNIRPGSDIKIRILQNKNYYFIGSTDGRKIIIEGKTDELKEGSSIEACGAFKKDMDFQRGIVGRYKLKKYKMMKKDIVYYSYEYKRIIYERFKNILGESRTALVMGICYGDTRYMTQDQNEEFQKLGVIHAVSVSGFHMAIIYQALEGILGFKIAAVISAVYVFFTGMSAATVRSFIMIFLFKISKVLFREYDSLSSLSMSAIILMMARPYYIVDIGFSLSFLSTLGIILYYGKLCRIFYILPQKLNEGMSLTLSSQIFSLPYIAFTIQNFSYGFILGNLFLLPLYSIIVVLGNIALAVSFIGPIFNMISRLVNIVIMACEGASSTILNVTPEIMYLNYIHGIVMLSVYISFVLYRAGYEKVKYMPAILLAAVWLQNYSFITSVTFLNFQDGEAVILKNKNKRVMVCNYDSFNGDWIINIKDSLYIDKIITNPEENYIYKLDENSFLRINSQGKYGVVIKLHEDKGNFNFILNKSCYNSLKTTSHNVIYIPKIKIENSFKYEDPLDKSVTYGIIFNRLIPIKTIEKR